MTVEELNNPETDGLFDAIAALLPPEQLGHFHRRMFTLRHLHPEDEMLHIFEAMGFLTFIIRDAPREVAAEREKLASLLGTSLAHVQGALKATADYHRQLDARLTRLPEEITRGINPSAIAAGINESIRQRFHETELPQTAHMIRAIADQLNTASGEFGHAVATFGDADRGSVALANRALHDVRVMTNRLADDILDRARLVAREIRITVFFFCCIAFIMGGFFFRWISSQ
jgi:hypothetical protein